MKLILTSFLEYTLRNVLRSAGYLRTLTCTGAFYSSRSIFKVVTFVGQLLPNLVLNTGLCLSMIVIRLFFLFLKDYWFRLRLFGFAVPFSSFLEDCL